MTNAQMTPRAILERARRYAGLSRVSRLRQGPSLVEVLEDRYFQDGLTAEYGEYGGEMVDDVAKVMEGHPDVVTVSADYSGGCGYARAFDRRGRLIAAVDVSSTGALSLSTPCED